MHSRSSKARALVLSPPIAAVAVFVLLHSEPRLISYQPLSDEVAAPEWCDLDSTAGESGSVRDSLVRTSQAGFASAQFRRLPMG